MKTATNPSILTHISNIKYISNKFLVTYNNNTCIHHIRNHLPKKIPFVPSVRLSVNIQQVLRVRHVSLVVNVRYVHKRTPLTDVFHGSDRQPLRSLPHPPRNVCGVLVIPKETQLPHEWGASCQGLAVWERGRGQFRKRLCFLSSPRHFGEHFTQNSHRLLRTTFYPLN